MQSETLPILKFKPILKQVPWGGERIIPFKNITEKLSKVGESWEISDIKNNVSVVSQGEFAGTSLSKLIETYKERLVGNKVYKAHGQNFPLLIKFIDAKQDLSIQVHPDDELAQQRGFQFGKTEMWYIVDAKPGAYLLSGFNTTIDKKEFKERSHDGSICDVIAKHQVTEGDCFFIPAGQVHAICSDIFLIEIQQSSDVTYRLYDYNRLGMDGKLRQLHIDEAEDAINFEPNENSKTNYTCHKNQRNQIAKCPYFTTSVYELDTPITLSMENIDSFTILIAYKGGFTLNGAEQTHVNAGESVLIPAEIKSLEIVPDNNMCKFIETHID